MIQPRYEKINIFENREVLYMRKESNKIISWITILIIGSIVLLGISFFYEFDIEYIYHGKIVINGEENYIQMMIDYDFYKNKNRNYLYIENEKNKCHVELISDNYYIYNGEKYWDSKIKCELKEKIIENNKIVEIKLEKKKTTLFKIMLQRIKKGIKNARIKK